MATVAHLFAGVTDYFRAFAAKDYAGVKQNAAKRFNPTALAEQRGKRIEAFETKMNQNPNLTADQVSILSDRRNIRHAVGDFLENSFGAVGSANSIIGGTLGYATKKAITAPFKIPGQIRNVKSGMNELDELGQLRATAKTSQSNYDDVVRKQSEATSPRVGDEVELQYARAEADDASIAAENAANNLSRNAKNVRTAQTTGAVGAGAGVLGGTTKGLLEAGELAADGLLPVAPGLGGAIAGAMPGMKHIADQALMTSRIAEKPIRNEISATMGALTEAVAPAARFAGRGVKEYGQNLGKDAWRGAKWFHENRHSRAVTVGAAAGALVLMNGAYEGGQKEAKYMNKLQQMGAQMEVSNDGGGTFLRPNQTPQVDNMGATGDLVFALHSLRNGG